MATTLQTVTEVLSRNIGSDGNCISNSIGVHDLIDKEFRTNPILQDNSGFNFYFDRVFEFEGRTYNVGFVKSRSRVSLKFGNNKASDVYELNSLIEIRNSKLNTLHLRKGTTIDSDFYNAKKEYVTKELKEDIQRYHHIDSGEVFGKLHTIAEDNYKIICTLGDVRKTWSNLVDLLSKNFYEICDIVSQTGNTKSIRLKSNLCSFDVDVNIFSLIFNEYRENTVIVDISVDGPALHLEVSPYKFQIKNFEQYVNEERLDILLSVIEYINSLLNRYKCNNSNNYGKE